MIDLHRTLISVDVTQAAHEIAALGLMWHSLINASRMEILDQYDNDGLFATVFACNEAIARINEKNTTIAARLNAAADQITESAAKWDMAPADRPRTARARPR